MQWKKLMETPTILPSNVDKTRRTELQMFHEVSCQFHNGNVETLVARNFMPVEKVDKQIGERRRRDSNDVLLIPLSQVCQRLSLLLSRSGKAGRIGFQMTHIFLPRRSWSSLFLGQTPFTFSSSASNISLLVFFSRGQLWHSNKDLWQVLITTLSEPERKMGETEHGVTAGQREVCVWLGDFSDSWLMAFIMEAIQMAKLSSFSCRGSRN